MAAQNEEVLDKIFFALSDATRREILKRLAQEELSVNEIAKPFEISLAAVSKHLQVLEKADLVTKEKQGRSYRCRMNYASLEEVTRLIQEYKLFWSQQLDSLEDYFDNQQESEERQ